MCSRQINDILPIWPPYSLIACATLTTAVNKIYPDLCVSIIVIPGSNCVISSCASSKFIKLHITSTNLLFYNTPFPIYSYPISSPGAVYFVVHQKCVIHGVAHSWLQLNLLCFNPHHTWIWISPEAKYIQYTLNELVCFLIMIAFPKAKNILSREAPITYARKYVSILASLEASNFMVGSS